MSHFQGCKSRIDREEIMARQKCERGHLGEGGYKSYDFICSGLFERLGIIVQDFVVFHQTEQRPYFLALSRRLKHQRNFRKKNEKKVELVKHLEIVCNQADWKYLELKAGR